MNIDPILLVIKVEIILLHAPVVGHHVTNKSFPPRKAEQKKQQHGYGLMLGLAELMPDCWLEVRLHPEGSATGQLDFPWFSLVQEQMLSWYPNSTLHCMLPMQPSQW
jgi:hypothetical protein